MEVQQYLDTIKKLHDAVLAFVDNETDEEEKYENLIQLIQDNQIKNNKYELDMFIRMICQIINNHHISTIFFNKIEKIIIHFKEEIKNNYSNDDILDFFIDSKRILLSLIKEEILTVNESIYRTFISDHYKKIHYNRYFFPENKQFLPKVVFINMQRTHPYDFEEKRKKGDAHDEIVELIRNDSLDEFISFVKMKKYSFIKSLSPSIYESNSFLNSRKSISLINYAAYYGSIKIFKFLFDQNVTIEPIVWIYAVHSNNLEMIQILENYKIQPYNSYDYCLKESIKCHHNDITNYLYTKYSPEFDLNHYAIRFYNFAIIKDAFKNEQSLSFFCKYNYYSLMKIVLCSKNFDVNSKLMKGRNEINILFFSKNIADYCC